MASLELVDHTQELRPWHLPQQQHGARQPAPVPREEAESAAQQEAQNRLLQRS